MMCYENSEEEKNENGGEENKEESKNLDVHDDEGKVDPGTARDTENPQATPPTLSYVSNIFMTGITSEWAMSMIEDNLATPRVTRSVQAGIDSSTHGQEEKS